jgi:uncharacterized protein DUF1236
MRNLLLTSTTAVCLVLAGQVANAQSDQKKEEMKKEQVQQHQQQPAQRAQEQQQKQHQQQPAQRAQEQQQKRDQHAQQQQHRRSTTGQAAEEKKNEEKKNQTAEEKKNEPSKGAASSSEKKDQNAATKPSSETNKSAQSEKSKREEMKKSAEEQKQNATPSKSTASEQNKANQSTKPSTAEAPKSSTAPKQENASTPSSNTNTANTTTNKSTTNTASQPQPNSKTNAAQLDPQKKVQISETISKHHDLAPPVRNTNISITVGQRVPRDIHLHRLPREIVTIAPEYRDYEYFTTEQDIVIVSPRTHEIVTEISRDPSRARAEVTGGGSSGSFTAMSSNASSGSMPCQVMRRTASGDMQPMDPSQLRQTTGSGTNSDRLAVRVQAPNGQQMPEVTLPDREGRIIAEANGSDCKIILEPGQVGR